MLAKSMKRADRRWRSWCVWMRRLRKDWNMHGWKQDPRYDHEVVNGCVVAYLSERTSLCSCFDLTSKNALRFKDTPNTRSFDRADWGKYRNGRGEGIPIQERRQLPVSREYFARRKRLGGIFKDRIRCRCGYFLHFRLRKMGTQNRLSEWRLSLREQLKLHCPDCKRKQDEYDRAHVFGRSGALLA